MISGFAKYELAKETFDLPVQTEDLEAANTKESRKRTKGEVRKKTRAGRTSKRPRAGYSSEEDEDNTEVVTEKGEGEVERKKKPRRTRQKLGEVDMNISSLPQSASLDMEIRSMSSTASPLPPTTPPKLEPSSVPATVEPTPEQAPASGEDYTVARLSPLNCFGGEEKEVMSSGEESPKSSPVLPTPHPKPSSEPVPSVSVSGGEESASKVHIHKQSIFHFSYSQIIVTT